MSLLDKASLVQIPSGYKEDKLYSVVPDSGAGDFTFSRSSIGTRVNADGYIEEVPWNLSTNSEDYSSGWSKSNITTIANDTISPRGIQDATKIYPNSSGNYRHIKNPFFSPSSGLYTFSIYAKAAELDHLVLIDYDGSGIGVDFDLTNGIATDNATSPFDNVDMIDVGNGWYRCVATATDMYFYWILSDNGGLSVTANGTDGLYIWGAMINKGNTLKPYIKTTDRLDVPRLDYSDGSCASLLLEPQSTNLVTQSETFSNWGTEGGKQVVTQGVLISPDGTLNGNKLETYNSTNSNRRKLWIAKTVTVGASYTFSVYIKQVSGQINSGFLHITTGANDTFDVSQAYTATDQWQRVSVTTNSAVSSQIRFLITGDANSQIYIWGGQVEQQSYPTSYIPTSGSTTTRTADVCENAGTSAMFNDSEGVLFVEIAAFANDQTSRPLTISDGSYNNRVLIQYSPTASNTIRCILNSSLGSEKLEYTSPDITQFSKIAFKYKSGDLALWVDGIERDTSTSSISLSGLDELSFDNGRAVQFFYGKCKQLIYFNEALTDTELEELTTI